MLRNERSIIRKSQELGEEGKQKGERVNKKKEKRGLGKKRKSEG